MRHIFLLLLTIVWANISTAQSTSDELQQLLVNYTTGRNCNFQLTYNFYAGDEKKPVESLAGITQHFDDLYYFKIGNIEQLSDKKWALTVNHDESYVIADKAEKYTGMNKQMDITTILDHIKNEGQQIETAALPNGMKVLKIFEAQEKTPSWELIYRENYEIGTINVYFNQEETEALYGDEFTSSRLEIGLKTLPESEPPLKVAAVIDGLGDAAKLQPKYKKYTLYDLTAQK